MKRKRLYEIGLVLEMFELGQLQDFSTMIEVLKRNKISLDEFVGYVTTTIAHPGSSSFTKAGRSIVEKHWPRCPDHNELLGTASIPVNEKGFQTRWFCPVGTPDDPKSVCPFERFDVREYRHIMKDFYINHKIELPEAT